MRLLVELVLGPLAGYFIAYLVRFLKKKRFWRRVEDHAKYVLEDERDPISDPLEATERALLAVQREPVERIARAVRASIPPPPNVGTFADAERDPGKSG